MKPPRERTRWWRAPARPGPVPAEGTQVGALAPGRSHGGGEELEAKDVMSPWLALGFPLLGVRGDPLGALGGEGVREDSNDGI